jgi:hypothetical protein
MLKSIKFTTFGIVILAVTISLPLWFNTNLFDDAYIHARIIRNWIDFGFPSFLIGQEFKASSSTGYISIIFFLSKFLDILDAIVFFQIISIFLYVFSAQIVIKSFKGFNKFLAFISICAALPYFLIAAYGGMESSIILPLLLLFFIFDKRNKTFLSLSMVAIAVTLRFEMLSLFLPLIVSYYFEKKYKAVFIISFLLSLFFILEIYLYGTIIPFASVAKSIGYNLPIIQSFLNAISLNTGGYGPHLGILIFFLLMYSTFIFLKILFFQKRFEIIWLKRISFILASFAIIVSWILGTSNIFKWYLIPVCSLALIYTLYSLQSNGGMQNHVIKILSLVMMLSFGNIGSMSFISNQGFVKESINNRTYEYKKIGDFLYTTCPNCSLVTSEIGALGWSFKGLVYDGFGLADPSALSFHPLEVPAERSGYGIGAIPPDYIKYRDPDFIVSLPIFIEKFLASKDKTYFIYNCKIDKKYLGDNQIIIFSKLEFNLADAKSINCTKV